VAILVLTIIKSSSIHSIFDGFLYFE